MSFIRLFYFRKSLAIQINTLAEFLKESNQNIKLKHQSLAEDLKSILAKVNDEEEAQEAAAFFFDDNFIYYQDFPCYINESTLLIVYSFLEVSLSRICAYAREDLNTHRPARYAITEKLSHNYIHDSKRYLKTKCGLSLYSKEKTWKKLDNLRNLRNFIAHNNMDLRQAGSDSDKVKKKQMIKYINRVFKKTILKDTDTKYKIVNDELSLSTLKLAEEYLYFVIDKGIQKCKNKNNS